MPGGPTQLLDTSKHFEPAIGGYLTVRRRPRVLGHLLPRPCREADRHDRAARSRRYANQDSVSISPRTRAR
jgi:hypothetical protein